MSSRSQKIIQAAGIGNKSYYEPPSFSIQQPSRKRKRDMQSVEPSIAPVPIVPVNVGSPVRRPLSATSETAASRTPAPTTKTPGFATPDAQLVKQLERRKRRAGEEAIGINGAQNGAGCSQSSQDMQLLMAKMRFVPNSSSASSSSNADDGPLSRLLDTENPISLMMEDSSSVIQSPSAISLSLLLQQPGENINGDTLMSSSSTSLSSSSFNDPNNHFDADTVIQAILSADPKLASNFTSWYSSSSSTSASPWTKIEELMLQDWNQSFSPSSSSRQGKTSSAAAATTTSTVVTPKRKGRGQIRKLLIQGGRDVSVMRGALSSNNGISSGSIQTRDNDAIKINEDKNEFKSLDGIPPRMQAILKRLYNAYLFLENPVTPLSDELTSCQAQVSVIRSPLLNTQVDSVRIDTSIEEKGDCEIGAKSIGADAGASWLGYSRKSMTSPSKVTSSPSKEMVSSSSSSSSSASKKKTPSRTAMVKSLSTSSSSTWPDWCSEPLLCPTTFTTHHVQAAIALLSACAVKNDQSGAGIVSSYTAYGRERASRLVSQFLCDLLMKHGVTVKKVVISKGQKNKKVKQTSSTTVTQPTGLQPTTLSLTAAPESSRNIAITHALALRSVTLKFITLLEYISLLRGSVGGRGGGSLDTRNLHSLSDDPSSSSSSSEYLLDLLLSLVHSAQLKIEFARSSAGNNEIAPGFGLPFLKSFFGSNIAGTSTSNTASRKLPLRSASTRGANAVSSSLVVTGLVNSSENTSTHAPVAVLDASVLWLRGTVTRNYWSRLPEEVYTLYTEVGGELPQGVSELLASFDDEHKDGIDTNSNGDHQITAIPPTNPKATSSRKHDAAKELELVAQAVSIATAPGQKRLRENLEKWEKERRNELSQKAALIASSSSGSIIVEDAPTQTVNGASSASSTNESSAHSHSHQRHQLQLLQQQQQNLNQVIVGTSTGFAIVGKGLPQQASLSVRAPSIQLMMQASSFSSSASALDPLVADREKRKLNRMISDVLIAQRKDDSVSTRNIVKPKLVAGTRKR
jgi:hypothetical protein